MPRRAISSCSQWAILTLTTFVALLADAPRIDADSCPAGILAAGAFTRSAPPSHALAEAEVLPPLAGEAQELQQRIEAIAPFIMDGQGMQRVAAAEAYRAGVSTEALVLGHRLVTLNNRIARAARRQESLSMRAADFAFVAPFFRYEAQAGMRRQCGSFSNPTVCPARIASNQCFPTDDAAEQQVISLSYHRTADYAGGASGHDFTLVVPDPTCGSGPFRSQAIVHQLAGLWTYNTQGPEPNPEIFGAVPGEADANDYDWPYFWWGAYVFWWHTFFC
jgi:hypothetical protein